MEKGKGHGREQTALLSAPRGRFHQRRGIPFGEVQPVAADFQPTFQKIELRALSRTVGPLHDDQRAGVRAARDGAPGLRQRGFRGLRALRFLYCLLCFHSIGLECAFPRRLPCDCYNLITTHAPRPAEIARGFKKRPASRAGISSGSAGNPPPEGANHR